MELEVLWVVLDLLSMIVTVEGLYNLEVQINGYNNTGKCPGCIEFGLSEPGCCDRHRNLNLCTDFQRCDSYFTYHVRRLGSTESVENCTLSRVTGDHKTSRPNFDDASVDFTNATVLGLENPFTLAGLDNKWNGIQLLVVICDKDETGSDDLIDLLSININVSSLIFGVESNATSYSGIYNYTTVNLSFSVQCVANFQGPSCSECVPGFTGSQCEVNIDDCIGINCGPHGECIDEINSFKCRCDIGFTGDVCTEDSQETGIIIGGVVGGVVVLSVLLIMVTTTVIFLIKRRKRRQGNVSESEIKLSNNVTYGIERNATKMEDHVHVDLTQNASYGNGRQEVETNPNISYIPNQEAVSRDDYEYIPHEYDYIT